MEKIIGIYKHPGKVRKGLLEDVFSSRSTLEPVSVTALQICALEIPQKVVFFEIFLHWFKCTNYSLYDMIFFSKNTTGNTIYLLYLGQKFNAKRALEVHGKKPQQKVVFFTSNIFADLLKL